MEKVKEKAIFEKLEEIYSAAADKFEALFNKYKEVEQIMADKKNKKRDEIAYKFDMNYAEIINGREDLKISLKSYSNKTLTDALNNEKVQRAVHDYLYFLEEAEYMYPHARNAVAVYLRDKDNMRTM